MPASTTRYLEHLTEPDLALLTATVGGEMRDPVAVEQALTDPRVFDAVFGSPFDEPTVTLAPASPFLVFAVAVHRAAIDLQTEAYIEERVSAHQRLPVFDVAPLRALADDADSRLFMIELLGSFTRGSVDPIELARFLEVVPGSERAGVYRRLGDLALFLSGVFPDHTARRVQPVELSRMLRTLPPAERDEPLVEGIESSTDQGLTGLLSILGPRWYRLAAEQVRYRPFASPLHRAADRFEPARRFLAVVTDRYLFPLRAGWFPEPGTN
ncbi:MAG: hypothetical protein ACXW1S_08770 [Acidimicrobiia bacterium]